MALVLIGNPENRRAVFFAAAAALVADDAVVVIAYEHWLAGKALPAIPAGSIIKIDSPGENATVRKQLIQKGTGLPETGYESGLIHNLKSWYAGYCLLLDEIIEKLPANRHYYMNAVADIQLMFNKPACQHVLLQKGVPVPRQLPQVHNYTALLTAMQQQRMPQVFIKPSHASSASGVIAFRKNGNRVQAVTPVEMDNTSGHLRLFNSLKVRTYRDETEIAAMINLIIQEGAHAEEWIPKATLNDRYFDIRVLVINGQARHTVLRTSKGVITNLHLGNKRGDMQDFINSMGQTALDAAHRLAEQVAACFPQSLYMGVDILPAANRRDMYVLEVNAFGDLLPGLLHNNENCCEAEINAMLTRNL